MNGTVLSLQLSTEHRRPPTAADEVRAIPGRGLEGDLHGKRTANAPRQVLLLDRRTIEELGLAPGDLREQVTVDFPELMSLARGTILRVGEAVLEATGPCDPCLHIGGLLGKEDPEAFRQSLDERRGILARVVSITGEGRIRRGDPVVVVQLASDGTPSTSR